MIAVWLLVYLEFELCCLDIHNLCSAPHTRLIHPYGVVAFRNFHVAVRYPTALWKDCSPAKEVISSVVILNLCTTTYVAITIHLHLWTCIGDTYATQCRLNLLNGTVGIEMQRIDTYRAILIEWWWISVVMIEEIPLSLVVYYTMVVGPAAILMLSHDETLILIRTHRILTHCIAENFCWVSYVRIGEIVVSVVLEGKRTFCLTAW